MPGYVFKDGGPIPDSDLKDPGHPANQQPGATPMMEPISRTRTSASNVSSNSNSVTSIMNTPTSTASASNAPSDSHALASADDHEVKGAVQMNHEEGEVRNMGWNDHPHDVPKELVGGLPNEELWTLVRRFNKQMYHVKATNEPMIGGLDCYIVDEDEFSPDKLRSNIERLYMTVIIGMMGFGKHIARLRSWREPRRTGAFCAVGLGGTSNCDDMMLRLTAGLRYRLGVQFSDAFTIHDHDCAYRIPTITRHHVPSCTFGFGQREDWWCPDASGWCVGKS